MNYFFASFFCLFAVLLKAQPRLMLPVGHTQNITAVTVSPSGKFILSAGEDNTIILWERISGRPVRQYFLKKELPLDLHLINDDSFICVFKDKKIALVNLATGDIRYETESGILATSILRIGKQFVLYSYVPGDGMEVRNIADGKLVQRLPAREFAVYDSTTGTMATTNTAGQLLIYRVSDWSVVRTADDLSGSISALASAGNGHWIVGTDSHKVFLVTFDKKPTLLYSQEQSIKKIIVQKNRICSFAGKTCYMYDRTGDSLIFGQAFRTNIEDLFMPAGMQDSVLFILENGNVGILDMRAKKTTSYAAHKGWSGKLLSDGYGGVLSYCDDYNIRRWNALPFSLQRTYSGHLSGADYAAYDKQQQLLLTKHAGQSLKIRDLHTLTDIPSGLDSILTESISPLHQDSLCLVTTRRGTVLQYNYRQQSVIDSFYFTPDSLPQNMLSQTSVPDGAVYFAGDHIVQHINYQQALLFWQSGENEPLNSLWPALGLRGVEAGPKGNHLLIKATSPLLLAYETAGDSSSVNLLAELEEPVEHARFSRNEEVIVYTSPLLKGITFYDIPGRKVRTRRATTGAITALSPANKSNIVVAATGDSLIIADAAAAVIKKTYAFRAGVINNISWVDEQHLLLAAQDGRITCFNITSGSTPFSYIRFPDNQQIVVTDEGYYFGDRDKAKLLTFEQQLQLIGFEQLDVRYNRPDKVLERMGQVFGTTDTSLIHSYQRAYQKRMQRLGIDTSAFRNGYSIPEADFIQRNKINFEQRDSVITLHIQAKDPKFALTRFNLWINEVPVFGMKGLAVKRRPGQSFDTTVNVQLSRGENYMETSVVNANGAESFRVPLLVKYTPAVTTTEKVYFAGIGINKFKEKGHELSWSVKDIRDLCQALRQRYGNDLIIVDTLFDERVTADNIRAIRNKLAVAGTDDKVLLAYSGHGLLNRNYDYFLSTHDVDFRDPANGGLPYEALESLMDNIGSRKKLMLIDACHSGELDKQEITRLKMAGASLGAQGITAKGTITESTDSIAHLGLRNSFELMQSLFVNVSKGTGTTIISAAAGTQFAQEQGSLQNGVFTYAILRALRDNKKISINALKQSVYKDVVELTNGLQQPTSRQETSITVWEL
jgi:WD40 repeat protein